MWLYLPEGNIKEYRNNYDKSYTGWYYGAGNIDRVCAKGIMLLIKYEFDGISGKTGFFTPFSSTTGTEIIIWNQKDVLQRRPNHKYDSMQFVKYLHFDPFKINFDINLAAKNENFRMINFYTKHQINLDQIKTHISNMPKGLRIMSLNMHNLKSINLDDNPVFILEQLLKLLEAYDVDLLCCQEYYTNIKIDSNKYNFLIDDKHVGLVLIYKKSLNITDISHFKLPNEQYYDQRRFGLLFNIDNKKFCSTHLEIGKRFVDRSGSLLYADDLYKVIIANYATRKKQLDKILEHDPDYIIGDFNFNNFDKEFAYISEMGYYTGIVDYTTPFGKQVDFVFAKNKYNYFEKISYPYSDHLPIIAVI